MTMRNKALNLSTKLFNAIRKLLSRDDFIHHNTNKISALLLIKTSLNLTIIVGMLASPIAQADAIGDLIRLKTQNPAQATPVNSTFPDTATSQVTSNQTANSTWNRESSYPSPKVTTMSSLPRQSFYVNYANAPNIKEEHIDTLYTAESSATPAGKQVLRMLRQMALVDKEIIQGSCWDYLNEAFSRVGVARLTVFKGEYPYGPFIDTNDIQAGDWLYYVNHSYYDGEHSGVFIGWLNRDTNQALILSYAGESRQEPASYKAYDISHTYNLIRPSL